MTVIIYFNVNVQKYAPHSKRFVVIYSVIKIAKVLIIQAMLDP